MKSNWETTMELITMCMGIAIIVLGTSYLSGGATIPPALVTGISIAGFCLTLSDYIIKMDIDNKGFIKSESTQRKLVIFMHLVAVGGIIVFPNLVIIEDIGKENLEFISTVASVIALGFVILAIGHNNRKQVIYDIKEQLQLVIANRKDTDELTKRLPELEKELQESREQALQNKKEVAKLQLLLEEAQEELKRQNQ
ncbi:hypothetical protein COF38_25690 [Bacillus pseudomycoides]|uniref:hypothetical protein n=1 Tax=Bacillus pseudomycoides TaxID=64104 RepID=UPI000BF1685E|nr:hypothetical protein [Bacillus pseudomycoides]PEJ29778.1 hypothetical protein CN677_22360 [Bacillus pseudomycoides]PHC69852.1 hypothetical protein COF38_25690 [Bacillus pseudomycoides]